MVSFVLSGLISELGPGFKCILSGAESCSKDGNRGMGPPDLVRSRMAVIRASPNSGETVHFCSWGILGDREGEGELGYAKLGMARGVI